MCGINGFNFNDAALIEKMNKASHHRGPDYHNIFTSQDCSLGHVLLRIRGELNKSIQPKFEEKSRWVMIFNGEIYNTEKIKKGFLPADFQNEEVDTNVIYQLLIEKGLRFIEEIHGMYSIALFDRKERKIHLFRDPSGQKPIYYYHKGGVFIFSSEIKPLLSHQNIDKSIDYPAIAHCSRVGYFFGNKTLFKYIRKVEMGQRVSLTCDSNSLDLEFFTANWKSTLEDGQFDLSARFHDHFLSNAEMGINLSGGVDSSIIFYELSKAGLDVQPYSTRFEIDGLDEKYNEEFSIASKFAQSHGKKISPVHITKSSFKDHFIAAYESIEEPNYNISIPAYYITAKQQGLGGDQKKVIFSGDGGDEVFGGYSYYLRAMDLQNKLGPFPHFLQNALLSLRNNKKVDFLNPWGVWLFLREQKKRNFIEVGEDDFLNAFKTSMGNQLQIFSSSQDKVKQLMMMDRILFIACESATRSDKIFMSQSIELRSPFNYHPLRMFFDQQLSGSDYFKDGVNKTFLREQYLDKLPNYIMKRSRKWGWRSPLDYWYDKEYKEMFLELISSYRDNSASPIYWEGIAKHIEESDGWPGKDIMYYISLAIIGHKFGLEL